MNKKMFRAEKKAALDVIMSKVREARASKDLAAHFASLDAALRITRSRNLRAEFSRVLIKVIASKNAV